VEVVLGAVELEARIATREARLRLLGAGRLGHLPRKQTIRDGDDLVARTHLDLLVRREEGEHRTVGGVEVVGVGETVDNRPLHFSRSERVVGSDLLAARAKEVAVATRNVAVAHDVAQHHDVLRLGDDRLGVAGEVACKQSRNGATL